MNWVIFFSFVGGAVASPFAMYAINKDSFQRWVDDTKVRYKLT